MPRLVGLAFGAGFVAAATAACASGVAPEIIDRVLKTCKSEVQRFCPSTVPGDKRVGRCLLDHVGELGGNCLKEMRFAYTLEVCMPEVRQFCSGTPQGQALECLSRAAGAVSGECRRAMNEGLPRTAEREAPGRGDRYAYDDSAAPYASPPAEAYRYGQPPTPREAPYTGYYPQPGPYAAPPENYGDAAPPSRRYGYEAPTGPYARPNPAPYAYRGPRDDEEMGDGDQQGDGYRYGGEGDRRGDYDGRYGDRGDDRERFQPYGAEPYYGDGRYANRGDPYQGPGPYDGYGPASR